MFCERYMLEKFVLCEEASPIYAVSSLLLDQFNSYKYYRVGLGTDKKIEKMVIDFYLSEFKPFPVASTSWYNHLKLRMKDKPDFDEWRNELHKERAALKRKYPDEYPGDLDADEYYE